MLLRSFCVTTLLWFGLAGSVYAQFKESGAEDYGPKMGQTQTTRWRAGMVIKASGGACRAMAGFVPVPTDWPEQEVSVVEEEKTGGAQINYETVNGGVKIMRVKVGHLPAGQEATAIVTIEIRRRAIVPPKDTDIYRIADLTKLPRDVRMYLTPSPKIESTDPKIRELAKEIGVDKDKAWDHVAAIYDWVRNKVKYKNGPLKGALAALKDGTGDCEELSSLFIAICRAANIPARTVWVPGHCYSEFYLVDDQGKGYWFPCQSAGTREFGGISEMRPILQKGDNFRPPTGGRGGREHQRYMAESLTGAPMPNGGKPQVNFIREQVAK